MANTPIYKYDETSDTLTITFAPGMMATGIELTDHILLRINKTEQCVVGISFFDYSILAQPTEFGIRSLPITGLDMLNDPTRQLVLTILHSEQVQRVLTLSAYVPNATQTIPIATLQTSGAFQLAA